MFDEHGFGDDGTRPARSGESGDGHQQMQEQDDQIVHGSIMLPREIQEMRWIWQFAMHRWVDTAKAIAIEEVLTAPRSPWQNAFVERFIGFARRECLDHVIVFSATGLRRLMQLYGKYYEQSRTHLSLDKDAPPPRPIAIPADGRVVAIPQVGGLHHRYERRAA